MIRFPPAGRGKLDVFAIALTRRAGMQDVEMAPDGRWPLPPGPDFNYCGAMTTDYLNEPVGGLAVKDFTALAQELTVEGALAQIRKQGAAQQIIYFYVVDAEQRLAGVLPTRRLLLAAPEARLQDIMISRVVTIPESATVLEACEMFLMHKFLAFPVVTAERRLVGVINVGMFSQLTEDALGQTERAHVEEVFERIGFHVAEVQSASPLRAFWLRLPWLLATLAGGIGCALVAGCYETTLTAKIILAFFLTLVLGLSESVSSQSVTVTVESLRGRTPNRAWFVRAARKEAVSALMLGGTCGLTVGVIAWLWRKQALAAAVIGGSIAVSMVAACLIGLSVPAVLHRFKLDPKIAAGPMSLAVADLCTLVIYLTAAAHILG
jgi:magnesium transporter